MVLTPLQRKICRLLAERRTLAGDSYLAGGATLNELLSAPRVSRDLDLFHDAAEALERSWEEDRRLLACAGFEVQVVRALPAAEVGTCVLGPDQGLYRGDPVHLRGALEAGELRFHRGRIGGALPDLVLPGRG